jgi:hypothetical protein
MKVVMVVVVVFLVVMMADVVVVHCSCGGSAALTVTDDGWVVDNDETVAVEAGEKERSKAMTTANATHNGTNKRQKGCLKVRSRY